MVSSPEVERRQRFEDIALAHLDALYRTARRLTGSVQSAEDLVQDTYVRAYDAFERFDGRYPCAWLLTILRHTYISQCRHASQSLPQEGEVWHEDEDEWLGAGTDSVEDEVLANVLTEELERALAALPEAWRLAVVLTDIEGLSYEETARVMECPLGTVMSRLHRGRRRLEALLMEGRMAHQAQGHL